MISEMESTAKVDLVKAQTCFAGLSEGELDQLAALFEDASFKAGETLVREGDFVDSVFLIVEGTVDVQHVTMKNGEVQTQSVATLGSHQAIGLSEKGFYSLSGRRTATVVAITDVHTLRLSVPVFNGFALAHPRVSEMMRQARHFA